MTTALVINCSAPHYNLGAAKLVQWLRTTGIEVTAWEGDPGLFGGSPERVYLSVIFSWHAPLARDLALRYRAHADVACGGPGMFALATWWREQTGLPCHRGLDGRFEYQRGTYRMVFASRGCPVNCHFCLTPESVVITADGPKPIATLHVGELVLTHQGRYRRVKEVMSRPYDGEVVQLQSGALSTLFPTTATTDHPVWMRHVSYRTGGMRLTAFRWNTAGHVVPHYSRYSRDVFAYPRTLQDATLSKAPGAPWLPICAETLSLIGWYLAEGYVSKTPERGHYRVTFCLGHTAQEMSYAKSIVAQAAAVGLKAVLWHPKIGIRVDIHHVKLARWLVEQFGTGASAKRLPLWVRLLPSSMLTPMVEAVVHGDGWHQVKRGTRTWKVQRCLRRWR